MTKINMIALQAANGQYLSALGGGGQGIMANAPSIGACEIFKVIDLGNGHVALQAANGQYVSPQNGGGQGMVNGPSIGSWEKS